MFFTIYQITNISDGKIYIGKHQTKDLNDGYMGSGKYLKRAIVKYGIENFKKEILFQFDNESDMNVKESSLVTEEFCLREDTYNICVGGQGGFSYINNSNYIVKNNSRQREVAALNARKNLPKMHESHKQSGYENLKTARNVLMQKYPEGVFKDKQHSKETKDKIGEANSKMVGVLNSQFGTMWITNGHKNKKIKKDVDVIPEGWYSGRVSNAVTSVSGSISHCD